MNSPRLELFDLENLISKINSHLKKKEGELEIGKFKKIHFNKNSLKNKFEDKETELKGKFSLTQSVYGMNILEIFSGNYSEINFGYIFIEKGDSDISSSYGGKYESIKLLVKKPLEFSNGKILPSCKIEFEHERDDAFELYQDRTDYIRHKGFFWKEKDLSDILPSEWFLK